MKKSIKENKIRPFAAEETKKSQLLALSSTLRKCAHSQIIASGNEQYVYNAQSLEEIGAKLLEFSGKPSAWHMSTNGILNRIRELFDSKIFKSHSEGQMRDAISYTCEVFRLVHALSHMNTKNMIAHIMMLFGEKQRMYAQGGVATEFWKVLQLENKSEIIEDLLSDEKTTISSEIVGRLLKFIDFVSILPELSWMSWNNIPEAVEHRWKSLDLEFPSNPYHFLIIVLRNMMSYCKDGWQLFVERDVNLPSLSYGCKLKQHLKEVNAVYKNYNKQDPTTVIRIHDEWYQFRDTYKVCAKNDPVLVRTDRKVDTMYGYARGVLTGSGARQMPLGVFLNGPAGVGKSFLSDLIIRSLHDIMMPGVPFAQSMVCTRNSEKFMTNLTHTTRYIKLDDFNSMHSTSANPDPTILDILQIQNTTKVASVQAIAEQKGQIIFNNLATVATGNSGLRGVDKVYKCVSAIGRRFHIVAEVRLRREESHDPIFSNFPELGNERVDIFIGKFDDSAGKVGAVVYDETKAYSIREFLAYVRTKYKEYQATSETHMKLVNALETLQFDFENMEVKDFVAQEAIINESLPGRPERNVDAFGYSAGDTWVLNLSEEAQRNLHNSLILADRDQRVQMIRSLGLLRLASTYEQAYLANFTAQGADILSIPFLTMIFAILFSFLTFAIPKKIKKNMIIKLLIRYPNLAVWIIKYKLYTSLDFTIIEIIQHECAGRYERYRPARLKTLLMWGSGIIASLLIISKLTRQSNFTQGNETSLPQKAWDKTKNAREIVSGKICNNPQTSTNARLRRNLLKFTITSFGEKGDRLRAIRGICFLVRGRTAIFPKHYVVEGTNFLLDWSRVDDKGSLKEKGTLRFDRSYMKEHPSCDLASVRLNCQPGKDMEPNLPVKDARDVMAAIEGKIAVLWTIEEEKVVKRLAKPGLGLQSCNIVYTDSSMKFRFKNEVMGSHTFYSYSGMCGSLLVVDQTIIGMHVAGAEGLAKGLFVTIGKDIIDYLVVDDFVTHGSEYYELPFPDQWEIEELHPRSRFNFLVGGAARVHGTMKHHLSTQKSKLVRLPTANTVEQKTGYRFGKPIFARQSGNWETDPFRVNLLHVVAPKPQIPKHIFLEGAKMYYERIKPLARSATPLTLHQSVNGIDGSKSIHRIQMSTSTGYPYFTQKKKMLQRVVKDGKLTDDWELPPKILTQVKVIIENYEQGRTVSPLFKGSLKDEATKVKKIEQGKLRLFCCAPLPWCIVIRKYFLPLIEILRDTEEAEMAVGVNHRSHRWDEYAQSFLKFGNGRIIAGDYSKYDKNMDTLDIEYGLKVLLDFAKECGYDEQSLKIMRTAIVDLSLPSLMVNNDICTVQGTNPSGQPITVEVNCILNSIYMRCVWLVLCKTNNERKSFDDNVNLRTYGDDNIMASNWDKFNNFTVQSTLGEWGIKYTSPSKEEFEASYYYIEEVEFLKRGFRQEWINDEWKWVAPLHKESIYKCLMWSMGDLCLEAHIKDMIILALEELCIHDPSEWDVHASFLMSLFEQFAPNFDFLEFKISRENLLNRLYGEATSNLPEARQAEVVVYNCF
jgi:hypothetical protein